MYIYIYTYTHYIYIINAKTDKYLYVIYLYYQRNIITYHIVCIVPRPPCLKNASRLRLRMLWLVLRPSLTSSQYGAELGVLRWVGGMTVKCYGSIWFHNHESWWYIYIYGTRFIVYHHLSSLSWYMFKYMLVSKL